MFQQRSLVIGQIRFNFKKTKTKKRGGVNVSTFFLTSFLWNQAILLSNPRWLQEGFWEGLMIKDS